MLIIAPNPCIVTSTIVGIWYTRNKRKTINLLVLPNGRPPHGCIHSTLLVKRLYGNYRRVLVYTLKYCILQ